MLSTTHRPLLWRVFTLASAASLLLAPFNGPLAQPTGLPTAEQVARLNAILGPLDRHDAPGCGVAAIRSGSIVYERFVGMSDLERNVRLSPRTRFLIASTSKQFTAMAVVLLAMEGKIALEDDVRRYVPELPDLGEPITIRHLLSHTSGLREESNLLTMAGWRSSDLQTEDDILRLVSRQERLNFRPGEEFLYSNTGYTLLSVIVSRVSGMTFPEFVAARIFRPLGMTATEIVIDPARVIPDRAIGYWGADGGHFRIARVPYAFSGPTGVVTTLQDLARWDRNFYTMDVGGPAAQEMMATPGRLADGTPTGYGLGLYVGAFRGRHMISHAGSDPGFKAEFIRFPEQHLAVAVLCNSFDTSPTPIAQAIADVFLPKPVPTTGNRGADAAEPLPSDVAKFAGRYWNRDVAQTAGFFYENGKLQLDGGGEGRFELRHIGESRFLLPVAPRRMVFVFFRGPDSRMRVRAEVAGERSREFAAVSDGASDLVTHSHYAGVFYSPELDVEWKVLEQGGKLSITWTRFGEEPLTQLLPHVFQFSGGFFTMEFAPPEAGVSPFFEVTTERVRRLRFVRSTAPAR